MNRSPEKHYLKILTNKSYDYLNAELKFHKLKIDTSNYNIFQVKSAIIYLSRYEDEIDSIIIEANKNVQSILNAATVKEERNKDSL